MRASFALAFIAATLVTGRPTPAAAHPPGHGDTLHPAMTKLWEDHVTWTRVYIISAVADSADKPAATARLLQNQVDIGNAIKPFYGDAAGTKLSALLKDHILIATEVIGAARVGDNAKLGA